jgi:arylsulfatase A-like enzyme
MITVTMAGSIGSGNALVAGALSFAGVDQNSPIDAFTSSIVTGTHSSHTGSVATVTPNAWLVDTIMAGGTTGSPAGSQTPAWATYNAGFGGASYRGPIPSTGPASASWTFGSSGAASSQIVVALRPALTTGLDLTPPTVSITIPAAGSTISNKAVLSANATDNSNVGSVRFQVDGSSVGPPLLNPPYTMTFDAAAFSDGTHTITAIATDTSNNSASTSVSVRINNTTRPNIVLILSDDQRWDTMQYMPLTASLLANETVQFDNALVTTPDCCPSRSSILTGLYSHNTGVLESYGAVNAGAPAFNPTSTIATWLKYSGYQTGLFGKYLNAYFVVAPAVPPGWDEFHAFVKNVISNNDGDFYYNYQLNDNGVLNNFGNSPQDYSTRVLGAKVSNFIASVPANQPLFLYFAPYGPHDPETPDPVDIGSYTGISPWRPPSYNEADLSNKPAWLQSFPLLTPTTMAAGDQFRQSPIETLQSVDRAVANVITQLMQTGRWNNTVLVFMSDNGLGWGEHRMVNAKFAVYEESVRVPMWVRVPGASSRHDANIVANIDIAPTFASYAGVIPATRVNGLDMGPLITNAFAPWRSSLLLEYLGVSAGPARRFQAVRTSRYVYSELLSGERELYDLQNDPYELTNVYADPAYAAVIPGLAAQLAALKNQ